jgi:hypothetical protein
LGAIDWTQWSALATGAAALITLLLAIGTFKLAKQARRSADAAIDQAAASDRLAKSAEHDSKLLAESFRAEHQPRLRWARDAKGHPSMQWGARGRFQIRFEHISGPAAEVVSAILGSSAARVISSRAEGDRFAAAEFTSPGDGPWGPLALEVKYRPVGGQRISSITGEVSANDARQLVVRNLEEG